MKYSKPINVYFYRNLLFKKEYDIAPNLLAELIHCIRVKNNDLSMKKFINLLSHSLSLSYFFYNSFLFHLSINSLKIPSTKKKLSLGSVSPPLFMANINFELVRIGIFCKYSQQYTHCSFLFN